VLVDDSDPTPDTPGNCGNNANKCNTIQAGVDHATAGQTVRVAPGTYNEQVFVSKTLTLRGAQFNNDATNRNVPVAQESVVNGGFNLQANNIVLNGFLVRNSASGQGVATGSAFSGHRVMYNIIRNNVFGLYLNSANGSPVLVSRNLFDMNNLAGSASGNAIYSDQGLHNARIERNRFTGHQNVSMNFVGTQSNLTISRNEAINERTMLQMNKTSNAEVSRNEGRNFTPNGSAMFFGGGNSNVRVERNTLRNASFSGIRIRNMGDGVNTNMQITRNTVAGSGDFGIAVGTAHNDLGNPDTGGLAMTGGRIERNDVNNNGHTWGADGIFMGPNTDDNTLSRNDARNNAHHDAHDDSVGTRTAGRANTWTDNDCGSDQPNGLCE
jgi:hypothetical protein